MTGPAAFSPDRILVADRLGEELARFVAARVPELSFRARALESVTPEDVSWADTFVGFRPPSCGLGSIRWVQSTGAGVDAFLFRKPWATGRILTRTRGRFGVRIAEYCLARALFVSQRMPELLMQQAGARWQKLDPIDFEGTTAVVVGTGDIGAAVGRLFRGAGARAVGVSRTGRASGAFETVVPFTDVAAVLSTARWVILTLPLTEQTWRSFDARVLGGCRGAFLINVARGAVVDHDAMVAALDAGCLTGAALDVFETEPLPADSPLWRDPRIIVSPHCSALTEVSEAAGSFLDSLADIRAGRTPRLNVDPALGY